MRSPIATVLQRSAAALAFIGRHGTVAIAISLLLGMCLPFLAQAFRPILDEAILTLLTLAFVRIGFRALGEEFASPTTILFAAILAMLVLPAGVLGLAAFAGLDTAYPGLFLALFIALAVPPVTAVPIFAGLLRLPGAIALAFLILSMAITPFAAALHAHWFFPPDLLAIDSLEIGLRLAGFLMAAAVLAAGIRYSVGQQRLDRHRHELDGINVLAMFIFAVGVMDGVTQAIVNTPGKVALILAATFALAAAQMGFMRLVLFAVDPPKATAIALAAGLRNMGLMVAALGIAIPETTWLWFAIGQFPIFFAPWIIEQMRQIRR